MGVVTCAEPAEVQVRADASEQVGRTLVFGSGEMNDIVARAVLLGQLSRWRSRHRWVPSVQGK
jgi:hypothetical protein